MRQLYLVYRVMPDGDRHPESIMAMVEEDLKTAASALDQVIQDDAPEQALRAGERWEFVPQDLAPLSDWEEIAPPSGRSMPY
ncbi:MAG: hypothetical protein Q8O35_13940 [Humidesulfovibrio sp.]|jgi:hypothetical protein|uniref:hypothetical protein n=1 Tax=Humidesulfovibrio sp. TaxID=2910988 RepID=UPI002736DC18|nr:hypothetical protein [Humidesulfovibrio sp.]MDP2849270.1 hypothetical protein [Humidesulfovibrio sp.]